jgi:hypothetical protein
MSQYLSGINALYPVFGNQLIQDGDSWDRQRQWFDYRKRGRQSTYEPIAWVGLWPSASFMGFGENGEDLGIYDRNQSYNGWAVAGRGRRHFKVVTGNVIDQHGGGTSGVGLNLFLTANNTFVSSGVSNEGGSYELATEHTGNTHFVVAHNPGSPNQAGATINNLTPTNRDGT